MTILKIVSMDTLLSKELKSEEDAYTWEIINLILRGWRRKTTPSFFMTYSSMSSQVLVIHLEQSRVKGSHKVMQVLQCIGETLITSLGLFVCSSGNRWHNGAQNIVFVLDVWHWAANLFCLLELMECDEGFSVVILTCERMLLSLSRF